MGRAQARPLFLFILQAAGSSFETARAHRVSRTPGCQQTSLSASLHRRLSPQTPLSTASAPGPTPRHNAPSAPRQAQSSCWPAGRRVRPGVTAAPPLTLVAASHWLAGPSLGHACWHYRARPRACQAHIRECLGQQ